MTKFNFALLDEIVENMDGLWLPNIINQLDCLLRMRGYSDVDQYVANTCLADLGYEVIMAKESNLKKWQKKVIDHEQDIIFVATVAGRVDMAIKLDSEDFLLYCEACNWEMGKQDRIVLFYDSYEILDSKKTNDLNWLYAHIWLRFN